MNNDFKGNSRPRYTPSNEGGSQEREKHYNERTESGESSDTFFNNLNYNDSWIKNEVDASFPDFAEKIGKYMAENGLTNSKIRSIYGEIKRIQMGQFEKEKASFYLLRPKVAYALGRDSKNKGLQLFKLVFDKYSSAVSDQKTFHNFCNFLEAILAYHRAHGGKDNI